MLQLIGQKWAKLNKLPKKKRQERIFPNSEEALQASEALPHFASPMEAATKVQISDRQLPW